MPEDGREQVSHRTPERRGNIRRREARKRLNEHQIGKGGLITAQARKVAGEVELRPRE